MNTTTITQPRSITRSVQGVPTTDGAGVRLTRLLGNQQLNMLDPFLLLDEFRTDKPDDYIKGFPSHPHRGFETVTYMIAGRVRHKDNSGHEGVIESGGVQWMTAGRGIIHSEMPEQEHGMMWGFQLWVNLPAEKKMQAPKYQEFSKENIPTEIRQGDVKVHVITGKTSHGTAGPVTDVAIQPSYFNIELPAATEFIESLDENVNGFVYVYEGDAEIVASEQTTSLASDYLGVLGDGNGVHIRAGGNGAKMLLISGKPLNEPVAWGGPFVMNTQEEVYQAFSDYQNGLFE